MSILDSINADTGLAGTDYTFIDADTLAGADGTRYRIQGIDAPEVEKVVNGQYKLGTAGGEAATDTIRGLANDMGFTNVAPLLDANGNPQIDPFGRTLIDLKNENGESFKSKILEAGVLGPNKYTTDQDKLTAMIGDAARTQQTLAGTKTDNEWNTAAENLNAAIKAENKYDGLFKTTAIDEAQLAAYRAQGLGDFVSSDNVQIRDYDRSIDNQSLNPFSDSWEQGWIGVKESSFGMLNMLGESTGSEWLADIGEAGVERARTQVQDYGHILTDWKDIDSIGDAFSYVANNAALSLPYMAISVGGAVAAPVTGGLSLAAPASVYAGQTWNEMEGENKNAAVAIGSGVAQAALDRLGLGFIVKTGVAPTKLLKEGVEALVKKGMTREAAEQQVMQATRKELAGLVGDAAAVARQQVQAKALFNKLAAGTIVGASGEAVTEALQESVGYVAAHHTGEGFDFNELTDRALAGAIAGGALGGAFSTPKTIYDAGAWADVAVRQAPAEAHRLSQAAKWAEKEEQQFGRIKSLPELMMETKLQSAGEVHTSSFDDKVAANKQRKKDRSTSEVLFETFAAAPSLWRGATRWIFQAPELDQSRSLRILADMFGGQLQRTFAGSSFENAKHHKVSVYKNSIARPETVFTALNGGRTADRKRKVEISNEIYRTLNAAIDPETKKINMDLVPDNLKQFAKDLQDLGDRMWQDQKTYNPELGYLDNYLLRYKAFNKQAIYHNKPKFVAALQEEFGMSESEANDIADAIADSDNVNDFSDILEGREAAGRPGSHKQRTLNLSEKDKFQEFMQQDIYANISQAAKSAARYTAYQEYVGENSSIINQLLENARKEGVSDDKIDKIAAQMNDYLAAESGNYKRPTSKFGKDLEKIQKNLMFYMTIAGLPLATISSFVEAALTMRGLTMDQIFGKGGKQGGLKALGEELGATMWNGMGEVASSADKKPRPGAATAGKNLIQDLGYYEWDVDTASIASTATKVGATEVSPRRQKFLEDYFWVTGLQGWTNYTRSVRASIVGDYIADKLEIISTAGDVVTNEVQEAREQLRNLGINVNDAVAAYNANEEIDPAQLREAQFTFINDAVALPQAANRPLIFQDPRFALFTQFNGFISTFTANHIPKLWDEYVKRGTPAMKYNAFAVMTTMIMMGFASQYLKDLIKYGELRKFGAADHPFLSNSEYIQRGIRSSGLLGTGERVLDQFFPLYEKRSDNIGEWAWHSVSDEAPALSFAGQLAGGVGKLATGDVGGAAKSAVRATPFGPFNFIRNWAEETADHWNFDGS